MEFNEEFLAEMGLSAMPEDQKQDFLDYVQEELEVRIGERVARGLTDVQLNEFDMITDQAEAAKWLEINRPDYREIVARTIAEMKEEIKANRQQLLSSIILFGVAVSEAFGVHRTLAFGLKTRDA